MDVPGHGYHRTWDDESYQQVTSREYRLLNDENWEAGVPQTSIFESCSSISVVGKPKARHYFNTRND